MCVHLFLLRVLFGNHNRRHKASMCRTLWPWAYARWHQIIYHTSNLDWRHKLCTNSLVFDQISLYWNILVSWNHWLTKDNHSVSGVSINAWHLMGGDCDDKHQAQWLGLEDPLVELYGKCEYGVRGKDCTGSVWRSNSSKPQPSCRDKDVCVRVGVRVCPILRQK